MNDQKITMASIGGHGFGAKLATATAISNLDRFTGVVCLEGGPLDHRYHEAYHELVSYVKAARDLKVENMSAQEVQKKLAESITCQKWRSIFM